MRQRLLLTASIATLLLASGCANHTTSTTKRSATTAAHHSPAGQTPTGAAAAFADAYARYLDGRLPAAALPDVAPSARAQAAPVIPPDERAGPLQVQSVEPLAPGQAFIVQFADRAHTFAVQLTTARSGARWLVVQVQTPDLASILRAHTRPLPQPSGSADAERAARAFMAGYLPWLYGEGRAGAIHDATTGLLAQLKAHPPNIPPTLQGLHPSLAAALMQRRSRGWEARATVTDGRQTYDLTLTLINEHGRWLISAVTYPH